MTWQKYQIKSEKLTPFWGEIFSIMEQFDALLAQTISSFMTTCTFAISIGHIIKKKLYLVTHNLLL